MMFLLLITIGCGTPETTIDAENVVIGAVDELIGLSPSLDVELTSAQMVGAVDFDGDGVDEILLVDGGVASWWRGEELLGEVSLGGGAQRIVRGDLGDGEVLLVASGATRDFRAAETKIWMITADSSELIFQRDSDRNQVADLRIVDGRIWTAIFERSKRVQGGWIEDGQFQEVTAGGLSTSQLPINDGIVIGTVYGLAPRSHGELVFQSGEDRRVLPSLRGVRSLAAIDLNSDGAEELLVGDGWHYAYGEQAVGRLLLVEGPEFSDSRVIAMLNGEYSVRQVEEIEGRLLVTGTQNVHLLSRDSLGWSDNVLAPISESGNSVVIHTEEGVGALVSGSPARIVGLRD
jgi:hypothetical protein